MATAFNPQYVNLDRYEAAQIARRANQQSPLDAALQGLQQGIQLQQLPETLQNQQLQRQLQNAIATQKLTDLANPQLAAQKAMQTQALEAILSGRNPNLVLQPQVAPELQAMRDVALEQAGVPAPTTDFRQVVPGINGLPAIGLSPSAGAQKLQDDLQRQIELFNAKPYNSVVTPEGFGFDPRSKQLFRLPTPDSSDIGLEGQRKKTKEEEAKAKADLAKDLLNTRGEQANNLLDKKQDLLREQNDLNRKNYLDKERLKQKGEGIKLNDVDKKIVEKLGTENASKISILNQLLSGIETFKDPSISDEVKIVEGQRLGKILNSTEGKDALQTAERDALLPFLRFEIGNPMSLFDPTRKLFGRNLPEFQKQLETTSASLNRAVESNNNYISRVYEQNGGSYRSTSPIVTPVSPASGGSSDVDAFRKKHNLK